MEDGDGDGGVMDTSNPAADERCKDIDHEETNNEVNNINSYSEENNTSRLENCNLSDGEDTANRGLDSPSKLIFKGYKKRLLAQARETQPKISRNASQETQFQTKNVNARNTKEKKLDGKRGKITEYAQYLGLQPAAKYKCLKCHSGATFCTMSMLKQHQRNCTTATTPMQGVLGNPESSLMPMGTNFRITRKVYLCSACGTYFENWNLFLHMREVHKRHICLFCLGMFGQAERLSYHLSSKHSVPETEFQSVEDFYNAFKGSCYLICCNCEKIFSETDDFYNHFCSPSQKQSTAKACSVCKQTDSHTPSCTLASEARPTVANAASLPSHSAAGTHTQTKTGNGKGISKKIMRNNRLKLTDSLKKPSASSSQKMPEVQRIEERIQLAIKEQNLGETNLDTSESSDTELHLDLARDTVAETIMEVSRYVEGLNVNQMADEDVGGELEEAKANKSLQDIGGERYDSVTETIMEVSRFHEDSDQLSEENGVRRIENPSRMEELENNVNSIDARNPELLTVNPELDNRLNSESPVDNDSGNEETKIDQVSLSPQEDRDCSESGIPSSPVKSPTAHSLFSPRHELQAVDVNLPESERQEKSMEEETVEEPIEAEELDESTEKEELDEPSESQTSVSFNAVAATDRSLVIKICTNRVSKFSVATTNASVNSSRGSEENNNGEGSNSREKTSNLTEREKEASGASGYRLNQEDSDSDSEKLAVVDDATEETEERAKEPVKTNNSMDDGSQDKEQKAADPETDGIVLAGEDVPSIDLNVEGTMESLEMEALLKRCIDAASPTCVYCNHARQIAVNGKQLGLHMLAEHRFLPQHPAIIIHREQFTSRIKNALSDIETCFFNLDSYNSTEGTFNVPINRTYECFHCRFHSNVHKELYLHNRKMHQKTILICIMCKSTFYSYSELLCHLCPGVYSPNINVKYRCCLCSTNNLPSAFRLMVHLRKRHHACDVCLESTGNQQKLSNHVWKHKLHHLCYRCGIAYRNKPDITKHLFWKHGTESVLCKKCLQKKWPHVYHFCIPPNAFVCEECGSSFSRAVALKVHKRLHSGDSPHGCENCSAQFISKKLLVKHQETHKEPVEVHVNVIDDVNHRPPVDADILGKDRAASSEGVADLLDVPKDGKEGVKKVVDVYDLPPLNLSSDSDSDSDNEKREPAKETNQGSSAKDKLENEPKTEEGKPSESEKPEIGGTLVEMDPSEDEKKEEVPIVDGIWDNFKSYTASLEMKESSAKTEKDSEAELEALRNIILADHDYCLVTSQEEKTESFPGGEEGTSVAGGDGKPLKSPERQTTDVQNVEVENESGKKKLKTPRKKKQSGSTSSSDSSSDSDSSNCSCGTNCSCSSSSSGSSSSSSSSSDSDSSASEGSPRKQPNRKDRRKVKEVAKRNKSDSVEPEVKPAPPQVENGTNSVEPCNPVHSPEVVLRESDLDTDETETDEDFYDEHPQQLANKLLAEKRNQLMLLAAVAPVSTDSQVAPPVNNGAMQDAVQRVANHTPTPAPVPVPVSVPVPVPAPPQTPPQPKKKVKTKKRKKNEKEKQRTSTPTVESIKLNIPKSFYQTKPGFASSSPALITVIPSRSSTPNLSTPAAETPSGKESQTGNALHAVGSGSETDNKRSSKRKRVPKKFYGDSSDEESEKQPVLKWRKVDPPSFSPTVVTNPRPSQPTFPANSLPYESVTRHQETPANAASDSESEAQAESSSDSSESESETHPKQQQQQQQQEQHLQQQQQQQRQQQQQQLHYQQLQQQQQAQQPHYPLQQHSFNAENNAPVLERSDNLYCYCQCPYDEVSEMIACDGDDCRIEWFHFECVGIMVPPKGKWYCPDCRKKHGIVNSGEDYFD